ncbi:MAG: tetratricopeptide repeat protein, partial [Planctomycetota bacterium]
MAVEDLYNKACEAANKGNYGYAIELYREVLRIESDYENARELLRGTEQRRYEENKGVLYLALCYIKGVWPLLKMAIHFNKPRERLEDCEDLLELLPRNTWVLTRAGKAAERADLREAGKSIFRSILKQDPENEVALQSLGDALQAEGKTAEGLKYLRRLADLQPENGQLQGRVKNLVAEAHMQETKMEDASSFRDMIKDEDFAREAENKLDTAEERRTKELNNLESELERDPDNTNKISRLADLYRDDGRMKDALNLLEKASERQPENYQIREKLGDVRIEICDRALKKVASRLQGNPDDKTLRKRRDALNEKRKKIAVKEYEWRVQQHPTDNALRFQLGRAYYDVGKVNKAIGAFQKAARETHLVVEAAEMLGRCFMAKEQYD